MPEVIYTRWKTIAIVGYSGTAQGAHKTPMGENRAAHGAVCLLQARRDQGVIIGREVNSNGWHQEYGEPFPLDAERLARWQQIGTGS